jgi:uncharacterized protein YuzE
MRKQQYQIEIDDEADAAYVRVSDAPVAHTDEAADGIMIDLDANNRIVGVEVLGLSERVGAGDNASYLNGLIVGLRVRAELPAE